MVETPVMSAQQKKLASLEKIKAIAKDLDEDWKHTREHHLANEAKDSTKRASIVWS